MPPKTLSNGTMALKFMQKAALKAQNGEAAVVQLHQAKVVDEAEWDVGKEVRQAWGLTSGDEKSAGPSGSNSSASIVYEASYLPFMYGQVDDDLADDDEESEVSHNLLATTTSRPGRWSNLTKVEEPKSKSEQVDPERKHTEDEDAPEDLKDLEPPSPSRNPPPAYSGDSRTTSSRKKGKRKFEEEKEEHEDSSALDSSSAKASASGFLRPAGVDAPATSAPIRSEATAPKKKKKKRQDSGA
ncbi:hypothetical protein FRB90_000002 [Tulasnella sp. 427]|nr:hypothetical protein FRB90_000002 [Tulasnella sp. 427]